MSDLLSELEFHVNMRIICYMKCRCEEKLGKTVHSYFYSDLMAMFMMRTAIPYRPWITTEIKLRRGALRLSLTTSTLYTTLRKKGDFHVGYEKLPPPSLFSLSLSLNVADIHVEHLIAVQSLFMSMYVYVTC